MRACDLRWTISTRARCCPFSRGSAWGKRRGSYRETVIERFGNPFLNHRLAEIHDNHAAKKQRRFGGLIALARASGLSLNQPKLAAALAADGGTMPDA